MNRDDALKLVKSKVNDDKLIKHMMAVEACMSNISEYFNEDKEKWVLTGILHDIDYEETKENPEEHGIKGSEFLKGYDVPEDILCAIRTHAGHGKPETKMEISLIAADALSGLIVAGALIHPEGLKAMDADFILRRFDEKLFAQGADREQIKLCEQVGIPLSDFIEMCLSGMQRISDELGL